MHNNYLQINEFFTKIIQFNSNFGKTHTNEIYFFRFSCNYNLPLVAFFNNSNSQKTWNL